MQKFMAASTTVAFYNVRRMAKGDAQTADTELAGVRVRVTLQRNPWNNALGVYVRPARVTRPHQITVQFGVEGKRQLAFAPGDTGQALGHTTYLVWDTAPDCVAVPLTLLDTRVEHAAAALFAHATT
jgi:hypothetical protein